MLILLRDEVPIEYLYQNDVGHIYRMITFFKKRVWVHCPARDIVLGELEWTPKNSEGLKLSVER